MGKLRDQIKQDFLTAFKAREKEKANALRNLESALKDVEIDTRKDLSDEDVVRILQKELKKRQDSIELYKKGNRQDLVDAESFEVEVIETYLPKMLSREEVKDVVDEILVLVGSNANFGQVMGLAMGKLKGKADGKIVQEIVRNRIVE